MRAKCSSDALRWWCGGADRIFRSRFFERTLTSEVSFVDKFDALASRFFSAADSSRTRSRVDVIQSSRAAGHHREGGSKTTRFFFKILNR